MTNNSEKLLQEYQSIVSAKSIEMLKIRLRPGMEMLAQELGEEQRQFIPDWKDLPPGQPEASLHSPFAPFRPYEHEECPIEFQDPPCPLPTDLIGCLTSPDFSPMGYRVHHLGEPDPVGFPCSPFSPVSPDASPCDPSPAPEWWNQYYPNREFFLPLCSPYSPCCTVSPWPPVSPFSPELYSPWIICGPEDCTCSPCSPSLPCWYSPFLSPSPSCPDAYIMEPRLRAGHRRVSQPWKMDGTGAFPVLFIEACKVRFYENAQELEQFLAERDDVGKQKILLNMAHVVSVEKVTAYDSFAQNTEHDDVLVGVDWNEPKMKDIPFTLEMPKVIPRLRKPSDEMMFKIIARGGVPPYRFFMRGSPYDLFMTTDGWIRGFIEEDQWPVAGFEDYREYRWQIIVEDSSVPRQSAVVNFRYRLYPPEA